MAQSTLPQHIAIIMDGNGRWAKQQGLSRTNGHKEGANIVRNITQWCAKANIKYLTLYAFSTENWKRPKAEVNFLMKLLEQYLRNEKQTYIENNIRFKVIGDKSKFLKPLHNYILELEDATQNNTAMTQILALNYGSYDEIARAFIKLANQKDTLNLQDKQCVIEAIESSLDTAGIPQVDMLIRTGGEYRISNFLLWQISYAELFFTNTLWPDFRESELENMIKEFALRNRRFGGL